MNKELIYYKYQNQEISTPASEGYLTDFYKTKGWIEWLQKEFRISPEDFKKKQFKIQFKNDTTQPKYMKLFYTNEEVKKTDWGKNIDGKEFEGMICWPPIFLHPLIEDWLPITHECGWKIELDVRKVKEFFKEKDKEAYDFDNKDYVFVLKCEKCQASSQGVYKKCVYRVCSDHMNEKGRSFWIEAWKKLGVNPYPDKFKEEKTLFEREQEILEKLNYHNKYE